MKFKDHLTELIDGEPQYLGRGDDIWHKLDELGLLEAEVYEGDVSEMWLWLEGHDGDGPKQLAQDGQRVRVIVVPLE